MNITFLLKLEIHQVLIYCLALPTPLANQTNFRKGMLEKRRIPGGGWQGGTASAVVIVGDLEKSAMPTDKTNQFKLDYPLGSKLPLLGVYRGESTVGSG